MKPYLRISIVLLGLLLLPAPAHAGKKTLTSALGIQKAAIAYAKSQQEMARLIADKARGKAKFKDDCVKKIVECRPPCSPYRR